MSSGTPPVLPNRDFSDLLRQASRLAESRERELGQVLASAQRVRNAVGRVYGSGSDQLEEWRNNFFLLEAELRSARVGTRLLRALAGPRTALQSVLRLYTNLAQHIGGIAPPFEIVEAIETFEAWDRLHADRPSVLLRPRRKNVARIPPHERSRSGDRDDRGSLPDLCRCAR